MSTKVVTIEQRRTVAAAELPEGDYAGTWGGYVVDVDLHGQRYQLNMASGLRGIDIPCVVSVRGGTVTVSTK